MAGILVEELFSTLGLRVNESQWRRGNDAISSMRTAIAGLAAYFGGQALGRSLIGFNAGVEEAKNQIAGMLALSKKSDLSDELSNANTLYADLQRRAASLPGTTAEYVRMLGMLTQPLTDAGLGLQDLEDITVNAVVGAKALGVEWQAAARDIDQALRGQFHATDVFTGKILGSVGFKGEEGRNRFNAMSPAQRAAVLKDALTQKQLMQLAEAQGKTFAGTWSTIQDAIEQFLGKVGLPLFKAIAAEFQSWNRWLEANSERVDAFAKVLASGLVSAFEAVGAIVGAVSDVIGFLIEHAELGRAVLIGLGAAISAFAINAAADWIIAFAPVIAAVAAVAGLVLVVEQLIDLIDSLAGVFRDGSAVMVASLAGVAVALGLLTGPIAPIIAGIAAIVAFTDEIGYAWDVVKQKLIEVAETVTHLPIIKQLLDAGDALYRAFGGDSGSSSTVASYTPSLPASYASSTTFGDTHITVNAQSTDPAAIGEEVARHVAEHQQNMLSQAHEDARGGRR